MPQNLKFNRPNELNNPVNEVPDSEIETLLYARHAEIKDWDDLASQRGTPIPALLNQFYKFVQNPSTVSVETFKRMVDTDDTIGSGIDFLTTCLAARIGRYEHPNKEIEEWVNKALEGISGGFTNALKELLGASWAGFAVQEKVWGNDEHLGFVIKKLVTLPPSTLLFETERTGELTPDGILQYQRNYNPAQMGYGGANLFGFSGRGAVNDPYARFGDMAFPIRAANSYTYQSIRIPVEKCVHYAFDAAGKMGNPYGRSLLRRAYKWYVMKDGFLQMLSVALDRKGTPLTVVFADPNTTVNDPSKMQAGSNGKGRVQGERADHAAARAFKNVHNDTTIILPGKKGQIYDLEFVPQTSNASDFMAAIDLCNKSMLRALLVPSLIFGNGDGTGSYSLGQEHAKTFDKILDGMLAGFLETVRTEIIKPLLAYNWPKAVWKEDGIGKFGKNELSAEEIAKEMDVVEKAVNIGAVDMNDLADLNAIRDKIRFPPRTKIIEQPNPFGTELDEFGNPIEEEFDEEGNPIEDVDGEPGGKKNPPPDNEKEGKERPAGAGNNKVIPFPQRKKLWAKLRALFGFTKAG